MNKIIRKNTEFLDTVLMLHLDNDVYLCEGKYPNLSNEELVSYRDDVREFLITENEADTRIFQDVSNEYPALSTSETDDVVQIIAALRATVKEQKKEIERQDRIIEKFNKQLTETTQKEYGTNKMKAELAETKKQLEIACLFKQEDAESFDWAVLGKLDNQEQELADLRKKVRVIKEVYERYYSINKRNWWSVASEMWQAIKHVAEGK